MKRSKVLIGISMIMLAVALLIGCATTEQESYTLQSAPDGTITIFHTNDTHSRVVEDKYAGMGFAKIATIIEEAKTTGDPVLYMDAGDTFHGQTFATLTKGESIVKVLNTVGLDFLAPGNHDFNYGYDRLLELSEIADFKIISANTSRDGVQDFTPGYIIEKDGYRIGIFGLSTPETYYKTHPNNVAGVTFTNPITMAQMMVDTLEEKTHLIVALGHIGIDESSEYTSIKILEEVEGIDLFIDGHSHSVLEGGMMVGETLLVQTGDYDKNLGKVTVTFENGEPTLSAELISKEEAKDVEPHAEVAAMISTINEELELITSVEVGESAVVLEGARQYVRTGETNLGNLVADAMLEETGADVAITNGGGIRDSIDIGPITVKEIITVFPFGNYIVAKEVTGSEILEALEFGVRNYPDTEGGFPHIGGMAFTFDPSQEPLSRVTSLTIQGTPVDTEATYVLATNDFMAAGGDGYSMFADNPILGEYDALDMVLERYLEKNSPVAPEVEGRIVAE